MLVDGQWATYLVKLTWKRVPFTRSFVTNIITIYQTIFLALGAAVASVMSKAGEKIKACAYHATESHLLLSALLGGTSLFGRQMISLLGTEAVAGRVLSS